jgi:hypothetical protein
MPFKRGVQPILFAALIVCGPARATAAHFSWQLGFHYPPGNGVNDKIFAFTVFDDGNGPALFAAGDFTMAGTVAANRIAKWNGAAWAPLGGGIDGEVDALVVFDDGTGPALYASGYFSSPANNIAKWNGLTWASVGGGLNSIATSLAVWDDGSGPALYAGGQFTMAGGVPVNSVAKWDGNTWAPLGSGITGPASTVYSIVPFDDGTGAQLYANGHFLVAGGVPVSNIAKWDGTTWAPVDSGTNCDRIASMTVFDDGSGLALYVCGSFDMAGEVAARGIARWNGAAWTSLNSGLNGVVWTMTPSTAARFSA